MGISRKIGKALERRRRKSAFRKEFLEFRDRSLSTGGRLSVEWEDRYPCLNDRTSSTGFDRHYVYHTAWATRVLARTKPELHIDISSSVYFAALASTIVPMKHVDIRPPELKLDGLEIVEGSLLGLPFESETVESLSSMHVVEHAGLARYGDPMDVDGDAKAISELIRVLNPGGRLLYVVPVGRKRIQFNAHRIYSYEQVIEDYSKLDLEEFALIPDSSSTGHLISGASEELCNNQEYGCGCFLFRAPIK